MPAANLPLQQPYPGLRPFLQEDAPLFFGRAEEISRMLARLEENRFLAVVGGSGSGKSSLVRAGLLPVLGKGYLLGAGTDWRFVVMKPGGNPFGNLAAEFQRAIGGDGGAPDASDIAFTQAALQTSPRGFLEVVEEAALGAEKPLLLLVDQFEEIFRFRRRNAAGAAVDGGRAIHAERNDATAFVNLLLATAEASTAGELPIYVMITMRSDFIGDCEVFPGLPQAVSESQFLVPRMMRPQIQEAIEKPLLLFDCTAAPDLVNQMLNDAGTDPDQLPLMQHALMRTWYAARDRFTKAGEARLLTLADYSLVGRFSGALSQHLEEAWASLAGDQERRIAQQLFVCLSGRVGDGALVRRMAKIGEVAATANVEPDAVFKVVRIFQEDGRNFIIASPSGELSAPTVLDISHEALLRQWARLRSWLEEEAKSAESYIRVADADSRWKSGDAEPLQGRELDRALEWRQTRHPTAAWAERYRPGFDEAMRYLDKSRRLEEQKKRRARLTSLTLKACVAVVCVALVSLTAWALKARQKAALEQVLVEKALIEAEKQKALAIKDLVNGYLKPISSYGGTLSMPEIDTLWEIADADEDEIRREFLQHALSGEKFAQQLLGRIDYMAYALTGLSLQKREALLSIALSPLKDPGCTSQVAQAASELCVRFADASNLNDVAAVLVAAMEREQDPYKRGSLGGTLSHLGERLRPEDAAAATAAVVAAAAKETEPGRLAPITWTLGVMNEALRPEDAATAVTALVAAMARETDPAKLTYLGGPLHSLCQRLNADDAAAIATQITAGMAEETDAYKLASLGGALGRMGESLGGKDAAAAAGRIADAMEKETDASKLAALSPALDTLGERLRPEDATAMARKLLARIAKETSILSLYAPTTALNTLARWLPEADASAVSREIMALMAREMEPYKLHCLGAALGIFGQPLRAEEAAAAARLILGAMTKETDGPRLAALADALHRLSEPPPAGDAAAAVAQFRAAMVKDTDATRLPALGAALAGLGERLSQADASAVASQMAAAMLKTTDPSNLAGLGAVLSRLGKRLPAENAAPAATALVTAMGSTTDLFKLNSLAASLRALDERLSPPAAAATVTALLGALEQANDPNQLYSLGGALTSLGEQLPPEVAPAAAAQIVESMGNAIDPFKLVCLGGALSSVADRVRPEDAKFAISALLSDFDSSYDPNDPNWDRIKQFTKLLRPLQAHDLAEVLNYPVANGVARSVVLKALELKTHAQFHEKDDKFDLRLMPLKDDQAFPRDGKRLIIIARIKDQLQFRCYDGNARTMFWSEKELPSANQAELDHLKTSLQSLWTAKEIPEDKKQEIIRSAAALLCYPLHQFDQFDIPKILAQAQTSGLGTLDNPPHYPSPAAPARHGSEKGQ